MNNGRLFYLIGGKHFFLRLETKEAAREWAKQRQPPSPETQVPGYPYKTSMGLSPLKGTAVLPLARHTSDGFCISNRWDLRVPHKHGVRVPARASPGVAHHETELSWIRQIRQELGQIEASRQWAK